MEKENVTFANLEKIFEMSRRNGDSLSACSVALGFGKNYFYQGVDKLLVKRKVTTKEYEFILKYFAHISPNREEISSSGLYAGNPDNVLVIGDTHWPFEREGYLEHCYHTMTKYDCGRVVHIGDSVDNHYSSFHPIDPDGYSAGEELERVRDRAKEWQKLFPVVDQVLGNHDQIIIRKAYANDLSRHWIKSIQEVLDLPKWTYHPSIEIHGVHYTHGTGTGGGRNAAMNRALQLRMSCVQGHFHTTAGVEWNVSKRDIIFGFQVGCGIDDEAYAFAYAKDNPKKNIISCGVVLNKGKIPILVPMQL